MSKLKRCGGRLSYENIWGIRVFKEGPRGRRFYNWRCPKCGASGTNNGKASTCSEKIDAGNPEVINETQISGSHGTLRDQQIQERWGGNLYKVKPCKRGCPSTGCMCPRGDK